MSHLAHSPLIFSQLVSSCLDRERERERAVIFPCERTSLLLLLLLLLLLVGRVPEASRSCVTPEQPRAPYIEKETPQDQRKKLLSLLTPHHLHPSPPLSTSPASLTEGGCVPGRERAWVRTPDVRREEENEEEEKKGGEKKTTTNTVNQRAVRRVSGRLSDQLLWITSGWHLLPG